MEQRRPELAKRCAGSDSSLLRTANSIDPGIAFRVASDISGGCAHLDGRGRWLVSGLTWRTGRATYWRWSGVNRSTATDLAPDGR